MPGAGWRIPSVEVGPHPQGPSEGSARQALLTAEDSSRGPLGERVQCDRWYFPKMTTKIIPVPHPLSEPALPHQQGSVSSAMELRGRWGVAFMAAWMNRILQK